MMQQLPAESRVLKKILRKHMDTPASRLSVLIDRRPLQVATHPLEGNFFPLRACFIGQSLRANWLAEPADIAVPPSVPGVLSRCRCPHTQLVFLAGGKVRGSCLENGSRGLPRGHVGGDKVQRPRLSVNTAKNTLQCHGVSLTAASSADSTSSCDGQEAGCEFRKEVVCG